MMTGEDAKKQSNPKQERTPGPWQCHEIAPEDPDWGAFEIWSAGDIEDDSGRIISNGAGIAAMRVYGTANASHIVHCVNTYDEIVGALENCIHSMSEVPTDAILDQFDVQDFRGTLSRARAALAKAKGE